MLCSLVWAFTIFAEHPRIDDEPTIESELVYPAPIKFMASVPEDFGFGGGSIYIGNAAQQVPEGTPAIRAFVN